MHRCPKAYFPRACSFFEVCSVAQSYIHILHAGQEMHAYLHIYTLMSSKRLFLLLSLSDSQEIEQRLLRKRCCTTGEIMMGNCQMCKQTRSDEEGSFE